MAVLVAQGFTEGATPQELELALVVEAHDGRRSERKVVRTTPVAERLAFIVILGDPRDQRCSFPDRLDVGDDVRIREVVGGQVAGVQRRGLSVVGEQAQAS
ncbi:hypothetical protein [Actinokineospora diospyrosa]|uniref:hypothetical protein n=1 Tax=Actinokineospora diospyrosa TaxID=103728 RepID=UPI0020A2BF10|nr:hypothetical protein [Actinokineospora diospyrosa]